MIRLKDGKRIQMFQTDDEKFKGNWNDQAARICDFIVGLWKDVREAQLEMIEGRDEPTDDHYERIYREFETEWNYFQ
jgi:hypothetical protein